MSDTRGDNMDFEKVSRAYPYLRFTTIIDSHDEAKNHTLEHLTTLPQEFTEDQEKNLWKHYLDVCEKQSDEYRISELKNVSEDSPFFGYDTTLFEIILKRCDYEIKVKALLDSLFKFAKNEGCSKSLFELLDMVRREISVPQKHYKSLCHLNDMPMSELMPFKELWEDEYKDRFDMYKGNIQPEPVKVQTSKANKRRTV